MKKNKLKLHGDALRRQRIKRRLRLFNSSINQYIIKPMNKISCLMKVVIGHGHCHARVKELRRDDVILKLIKRL